MALPTDGRALSTLIVSTLDSIYDVIYDGFFNTNATFEKLYQRDRVDPGTVIKFGGGAEIKIPVLYNAPTTTSYSSGDTADTTETEVATFMVFQWKRTWTPINIDALKLSQNAAGSETHFFDLLQILAESAFNSQADYCGTMLYGDGTGNNSKNFDGLLNAVNVSANYATYGGITRSSTSGDPGNAINGQVDSTGGVMSKALLQKSFGNATFNRDYPDVITMLQAQFNELWERVEAADRNGPGPLRDVGFNTIRFNGAECVVDSHVPAGTVWGLNTKYVKLNFFTGRDFVRRSALSGFGDTGFPVTNQDMFVDQLVTYGNFTVPGPRYNFQIQNVS